MKLQWLALPVLLYGLFLWLQGLFYFGRYINSPDIGSVLAWGLLYDYCGQGLAVTITAGLLYLAFRDMTLDFKVKK